VHTKNKTGFRRLLTIFNMQPRLLETKYTVFLLIQHISKATKRRHSSRFLPHKPNRSKQARFSLTSDFYCASLSTDILLSWFYLLFQMYLLSYNAYRLQEPSPLSTVYCWSYLATVEFYIERLSTEKILQPFFTCKKTKNTVSLFVMVENKKIVVSKIPC